MKDIREIFGKVDSISTERRPLPNDFPQHIADRTNIFITDKVNGPTLFKKEIVDNLGLENLLNGIDPEKIDFIYNLITRETLDCSEELGIPPPGAKFRPEKKRNQLSKFDTAASVNRNEYQIAYDKSWIKEMSEYGNFSLTLEVKETIRHEMRHLQQNIFQPEEHYVKRSNGYRKTEKERPNDYRYIKNCLTGDELDAYKFGFEGIKRVKTENIRETTYKSLVLALHEADLLKRLVDRKRFGVDF